MSLTSPLGGRYLGPEALEIRVMNAVTPKGVEHTISTRHLPFSRAVMNAVTPKGVEHTVGTEDRAFRHLVMNAVTPKGVEHVDPQLAIDRRPRGDERSDAERR